MKLFTNLCKKAVQTESNLQRNLFKLIKSSGPISVFNFMREVLTNADEGYYMQRNVFGETGDFITSPEISQMFGELIGIWIVNEWINQNKPKPFQIIELGPGKGSLLSDALRAIAKFPDLFDNLSVNLVEISPKLRKCQETTLHQCFKKLGHSVPVQWFDQLDRVTGQIPSCIVANEFFDALPIHKFQRNETGHWREVLIDVDSNSDKLRFVMSPRPTTASLALAKVLSGYASLNHFEFSPGWLEVFHSVGERLVESGGFALIADYGHVGDSGDTFRAFRNHKLCDPLEQLGFCDLTADVNFKVLIDLLSDTDRFRGKLTAFGPVCQHQFLGNMGIAVRLQVLLDHCQTTQQVDSLVRGYRVMMDPNEMGSRFKFLSVLPTAAAYRDPDRVTPAGFTH